MGKYISYIWVKFVYRAKLYVVNLLKGWHI